jgi:hypothetical protein
MILRAPEVLTLEQPMTVARLRCTLQVLLFDLIFHHQIVRIL